MFYLIKLPVTSASLQKIVEIQVCMLRILARLHLEMLDSITSEYLNILEGKMLFCSTKALIEINWNFLFFSEVSNFCNQNNTEDLNLQKFRVCSSKSKNLNLEPFPICVKQKDVSIFQISILNVS